MFSRVGRCQLDLGRVDFRGSLTVAVVVVEIILEKERKVNKPG